MMSEKFTYTQARPENATIDAVVNVFLTLVITYCLYQMQESLGHKMGLYLLASPMILVFLMLGLHSFFTEVTLTQDALINRNRITGGQKRIALRSVVKVQHGLPYRRRLNLTVYLTVYTRAGRQEIFAFHRDLEPHLMSALERHSALK